MTQNTPFDLIVTNNVIYIEGYIDSDIYQGLRKALSYIPENSHFQIQHIKKTRKWDWDGRVHLVHRNKTYCKCPIKKDGIHFPTGLYSQAVKFFKQYQISYRTIDKRKKIEKSLFLEMSENFEIRDYQTEIVEKAIKQERGIIKAATGSGKTAFSAHLIKELGVSPFIFYVPSVDLLKQSQDEFTKFLRKDGKEIKIGAIGGGIFDPQEITVMTIQTAVRACGKEYIKFDDEDKIEDDDALTDKRKEILELIMNSHGMIADEVQRWAAESCQVISDYSVSARYKWGISGTPWRDQNDDILIDACFGKIISDVSASFLIDLGYLVTPNIYFIDVKTSIKGCFTYPSIYKKFVVENNIRNEYISKIAQSMYNEEKTVLILVKHIPHGKILEKLIPNSVFLHGSHSSKKRKKHLDKMREGKGSITIASVIFDEGIDVRALDTLILAGGGKSSTRALQRIGRTLRPYTSPAGEKKEYSTIIDFRDHCKYLKDHSKKREKIYRTEPRFNISDLEI